MLGSKYSMNTLAIREFLTRDGHPFNYFDLDSDPVTQDLLTASASRSAISSCDLQQHTGIEKSSTKEIAECLGFNSNIDDSQVRDLVIVGAGPAGLAAAVYAASKDLMSWSSKKQPGRTSRSSSKLRTTWDFQLAYRVRNSLIEPSRKLRSLVPHHGGALSRTPQL